MKMIIVIVQDVDAEKVTRGLTQNDYRVTRIASTGGFLRSGVVTLLIGVEDERVDDGIEVVREHLSKPNGDRARATLFVVPIKHFEQV